MNKLPDTQPATLNDAIVKRLMIRLHSRYFSLSAKQQESARLRLAVERSDQINIYLLKMSFNIDALSPDAAIDSLDQLSRPQTDLFNAYTTVLRGIGENAFWLNEYFADGKSLKVVVTPSAQHDLGF